MKTSVKEQFKIAASGGRLKFMASMSKALGKLGCAAAAIEAVEKPIVQQPKKKAKLELLEQASKGPLAPLPPPVDDPPALENVAEGPLAPLPPPVEEPPALEAVSEGPLQVGLKACLVVEHLNFKNRLGQCATVLSSCAASGTAQLSFLDEKSLAPVAVPITLLSPA